MSDNTIEAADLFCGAGGTSTGLLEAAKLLGMDVKLTAINHWPIAISTHSSNHPDVTHFDSDLEKIDPLEIVPSGKLALLVGSPECTHYSRASGGKPKNKQSRATVKWIIKWKNVLDIDDILMENVPEFQEWGPLHRTCQCGAGIKAKKHLKKCHFQKAVKSRKGQFFLAFIADLRKSGYLVEWKVLMAANYGDPTTRERLFIQARKHAPIAWPEPTHSKSGGTEMFSAYKKWVPASEIIDWTILGTSIFNRKKPIVWNTIHRIEAGMKKFCGLPFTFSQQTNSAPRSTGDPISTLTGNGSIWLTQPFLIPVNHGTGDLRSHDINKPTPTLTSKGNLSLVQPFLIGIGGPQGQQVPRDVNRPLPTVLTDQNMALVQPFLIQADQSGDGRVRARSIDVPMNTLTSGDAMSLVTPFLIMLNGTTEGHVKSSNRGVDQPVPTLTSGEHVGLVTPFLIEYYGTGRPFSAEDPLPTQTTNDRFALIEPLIFKDDQDRFWMLDILLRMLQPKELARAMSFPEDYRFTGTRKDVVKQIGNSVPVKLATHLCMTMLKTANDRREPLAV